MNFDPKKDLRFQAILAGIVSGAASLTTEARAEVQGKEEDAISGLGRLRAEFFWTNCFAEVYPRDDRLFAYEAYKTVRDTPAAQRFLRGNPDYFTKIDLALCKAANSIRKEWKQRVKALNQ